MLKYFIVITGFATLIGLWVTLQSVGLLLGIGFYISLGLSFVFSLVTFFAWDQNDRVNRLEAIVDLVLTDLLKDIGKEEADLIADSAKNPGMQNNVVDTLDAVLSIKRDSTERYWIYIALGNIGGKKSKSIVKKARSNEKGFALDGVNAAWELVKDGCKERRK